MVDKDIPETFVPFMKANNIQHRQITMEGTKKSTISISTMTSILELIHDKRNQPVLIHCNQGKVYIPFHTLTFQPANPAIAPHRLCRSHHPPAPAVGY